MAGCASLTLAAMVLSRLPSVDLEEAIAAATRAPLVLNTQPWLFVAGDDVIELRADFGERCRHSTRSAAH